MKKIQVSICLYLYVLQVSHLVNWFFSRFVDRESQCVYPTLTRRMIWHGLCHNDSKTSHRGYTNKMVYHGTIDTTLASVNFLLVLVCLKLRGHTMQCHVRTSLLWGCPKSASSTLEACATVRYLPTERREDADLAVATEAPPLDGFRKI